jgi:hypothetical protein
VNPVSAAVAIAVYYRFFSGKHGTHKASAFALFYFYVETCRQTRFLRA